MHDNNNFKHETEKARARAKKNKILGFWVIVSILLSFIIGFINLIAGIYQGNLTRVYIGILGFFLGIGLMIFEVIKESSRWGN